MTKTIKMDSIHINIISYKVDEQKNNNISIKYVYYMRMYYIFEEVPLFWTKYYSKIINKRLND